MGEEVEMMSYSEARRGSLHIIGDFTLHIHLLMTPSAAGAISATLQTLGRRFVPYINHCYGRSGTLWEGRFKASAVQEEDYLLACSRYIELNPVRTGMVEKPAHYPCSSYHANALGARDSLLSSHRVYRALGSTAEERRTSYQALFAAHRDQDLIRDLRACLQTGTPLGNDRFRAQIEQALGVRVGYSTRGRPTKPPAEAASEEGQLDMDF
jgi:putative transposase